MSWAKLDDKANEHRKQLEAGGEACWLWACGLMYANRQKARDGFIPKLQVPALYAAAKSPKKLEKKLVEVGLWDPVPGGYLIHNYHKINPTKEQYEAELKAGRDRAAASYAAKKDGKKQNSSPEEPPKKERRTEVSSEILLDPLHSTPKEAKASSNPLGPDDPESQPVPMRGDWRPSEGVKANLMLAGIPDWAVDALASMYAAGQASSKTRRTATEWDSSFAWWAPPVWRDEKRKPKKPSQNQANDEDAQEAALVR